MAAQKTQQLLQIAAAQRQARLAIGGVQNLLGIAQGPMSQQAHRRHAQFEIATAYRVGQGPARRAVQRR
ncbi:hypothetical protein D9M68_915150 [compost metagenome]